MIEDDKKRARVDARMQVEEFLHILKLRYGVDEDELREGISEFKKLQQRRETYQHAGKVSFYAVLTAAVGFVVVEFLSGYMESIHSILRHFPGYKG